MFSDMFNGIAQVQSSATMVAENKYCRWMAISKVTVKSRMECHKRCNITPGCVFYNYKKSDKDRSVHCHICDPLHGELYSEDPESLLGWKIYFIQEPLYK